jgi:hypothetical protein
MHGGCCRQRGHLCGWMWRVCALPLWAWRPEGLRSGALVCLTSALCGRALIKVALPARLSGQDDTHCLV